MMLVGGKKDVYEVLSNGKLRGSEVERFVINDEIELVKHLCRWHVSCHYKYLYNKATSEKMKSELTDLNDSANESL